MLVHSQRVNTAAQYVLVDSLKVVLVHRQKVSTATQSLLNDHVQTKTKHSCTIYSCAQLRKVIARMRSQRSQLFASLILSGFATHYIEFEGAHFGANSML